MRKPILIAAFAGAIATAVLGAAVVLGPGDGTASSHREAPLIADDPSADLTDVYAFRSPDKPSTVTILANVIPGEDPGAGPELVHVLARRSLQPEDRHDGRRQARRDLPVPVPAEDRAVLPRRYRAAVHGDAGREGEDDGGRPWDDAAEQHRQALDSGLPEPRGEGDRRRSTATPRRRSPASATIRSSATSGRSSTSSRSARARGTRAAGRTSSPATACTRSPSRCPSPALTAKNGTIGVWASVDRRKVTTRGADDARRRERGCRSTGSGTPSSTR